MEVSEDMVLAKNVSCVIGKGIHSVFIRMQDGAVWFLYAPDPDDVYLKVILPVLVNGRVCRHGIQMNPYALVNILAGDKFRPDDILEFAEPDGTPVQPDEKGTVTLYTEVVYYPDKEEEGDPDEDGVADNEFVVSNVSLDEWNPPEDGKPN